MILYIPGRLEGQLETAYAVLSRYARNDRFAVRNRVMGISPRPVLTTLLDFISEDEMEEAGRRVGETHPRDVLTVSGFAIDASSFMPLLEIIADYGFWCTLERPSKPSGSQIYHLRHDLGSKWTRFLRGYVGSAKKLLGLSITIDHTEFTVTINVHNNAL